MECARFGRWPLASKRCTARISCLRGRSQVASNINVSMVRVPDIFVRRVAFAHRRSPERLALHLQETKGRGQYHVEAASITMDSASIPMDSASITMDAASISMEREPFLRSSDY